MRTVLAVDEMLAFQIKGKLRGSEATTVDFAAMKAMGQSVDAETRKIVLVAPSVLVIGGRGWNALPMLRAMKLPVRVPVIVVTPEGRFDELVSVATELRAFSVVAADRAILGHGLASAVAAECRAAAPWVGRSQRRIPPRVPFAPRRPKRGDQAALAVLLRHPAA